MRRRLLLGLPLLLAAPAARSQPAVTAATRPFTVRDDTGVTLRLAAPARRIVALSPQLVELCFAAGAGARLVGTLRGADTPPAARRLPHVGDAFAIDLEALAALRPDLILAWREGTPSRQLGALRRLGIPVYWSDTRDLADIADTVQRIGRLAGTEVVADAWASAYRERLRALREQAVGQPPVRVFFESWPAPLMTVGAGQFIDHAIRLCGGVNVFGDLHAPAPQVAREAVLARDPQLIVTSAPAGDALRAWRAFPRLSAVRLDRLVELDAQGLPRMGAQVLDGVQQLCRAIAITRQRIATPR